MPRPQPAAPSAEIEALIRRFAGELEGIIRAELDARLREALGQVSPLSIGSSRAAATSARYQPQQAGRKMRLCTVPGCQNPAAGPKYGWKCREHGASYRAKQKAKASGITAPSNKTQSSSFVSLPAPKAAAVIPADVPIKRLPPGPTPHDPKRAGPPMECRLPGCLLKSRGPRYEFFCADHYAQLNADDRRKYTEMWKSRRAGIGA